MKKITYYELACLKIINIKFSKDLPNETSTVALLCRKNQFVDARISEQQQYLEIKTIKSHFSRKNVN